MALMQNVVRKQKKTLVMVTHDNHLATYADRSISYYRWKNCENRR